MKNILLAFLTIILLHIGPSEAKEMKSSTPVFGHKVEFTIPNGWKPVFENATAGHYMMEFVPNNQTKESWSEMFTIQGFKDMARTAKPESLLGMLGKMHQDLCGNDMVFSIVAPPKIENYEVKSAIVGCSSIAQNHPSGLKAGMGEVGYYVAVQGDKDMYLFHKALRTKAFDKKTSPITPENAQEFLQGFLPIRLCNKASKFNECLK